MSRPTWWTQPVQRAVLCFAVALLTYWCSAAVIFPHWPEAQAALVAAIAAGLIGSVLSASVSAALVTGIGAIVSPHTLAGRLSDAPWSLLWILLAAGVAALLAALISRRIVSPRWVFWAAVMLLVVNFWINAVAVDLMPRVNALTGQSRPSIVAALTGDVGPTAGNNDEYLYEWLLQRVRSGTDYYTAFAQARAATIPGAPAPESILNFREPALFIMLAKLPNPWGIVVLQTILITGAAVAVTFVARDAVKLPVTLPGIAAVLSMGMLAITQVPLFVEGWAGPLCLIALALIAASIRSPHWKLLVGLAAATALAAFVVRELAVLVLFAGIAAAWFSVPQQRRFRLVAWGAALVLAVAAYATHMLLAAPHLVVAGAASVGSEGFALFSGGPGFAIRALIYGADELFVTIHDPFLVPSLLAVLGILGAFLLPRIETRIVALGTIGGILLLSLVAGNSAHDPTGQAHNYWGAMSMFVLYACAPVAFSLIAAARAAPPDPASRKSKRK